MSTAIDARHRPSLWSYLSFGSPPHRRSGLSPMRHHSDQQEKENTPPKNWGRGRADTLEGYREASMTGGQRSRFLKTGGIIAFIILLFYIFSSRDGAAGVKGLVRHTGAVPSRNLFDHAWLISLQEVKGFKRRSQVQMERLTMPLGRRSARSPARRTHLWYNMP